MSSLRTNPLYDLPQFQLLRKAISEAVAPLVLVVGSGLSVPAGLPDWKALRKEIQIKLDNIKSSYEFAAVEYDAFAFKEAHKTEDYWQFFRIAKKLMTPATFNETIRIILDPPDIVIPEIYNTLLKLRPKGLVTLNLDRISSLALAAANPGRPINTIQGKELSHKWPLLREESPFLVHLHGHVVDSSTWVLDQEELSNLTQGEAHRLFLSSLYLDNTVLFVGVSADDIALSGALLRLRRAGMEPHRLFWLTDRADAATTSWASENHVQLIQYKAKTPADHHTEIKSLVDNTGPSDLSTMILRLW